MITKDIRRSGAGRFSTRPAEEQLRKTILLLFIAVLAHVSVPICSASRGLPEQVIPDCLGVAIHFWGDQDAQVKQIADAGFKWVRMDLFWFFVEKEKGRYDFSEFDKLLASLRKHGMRAYFILAFGNGVYSGEENDKIAPSTPEYRKAYADYAAAAAAHFRGKGVIWEIWNEPNAGGFWQPQPNVEDYMAMAREAAAAIRAADPDAFVVAPATHAIDFTYLDQCFKGGLLDAVDGVSVHPYGHWPPDKVVPTYAALQNLMREYGKDTPVISGEWGFSVAAMPAEMQAQFLVRMMLVNILSGVPLSIWYDWHDDGDDPANWEHNFGVVTRDFQPKPSYHAMRTLTTMLNGHRLVRRARTDREDDFVLVFSDGRECRLVAWTMVEPHEISLEITAPAVVITDMLGRRRKGEISDATLRLTLTGSPCYISNPYDVRSLGSIR